MTATTWELTQIGAVLLGTSNRGRYRNAIWRPWSRTDGTSFTFENTGVVCFTSGTVILTETGERLVDSLCPGDRIVTRDNGVQTLQWLAQRTIGAEELRKNAQLHPVLIRPDPVGATAPLLVSPQHGVLLRSDWGDEILVRAIHLARRPGGQARVANGLRHVTCIHLMFDAHQIVIANVAPSESFYPGPMALAALSDPVRDELRMAFPDLFTAPTEHAFGARARTCPHARPAAFIARPARGLMRASPQMNPRVQIGLPTRGVIESGFNALALGLLRRILNCVRAWTRTQSLSDCSQRGGLSPALNSTIWRRSACVRQVEYKADIA